MKVPPTSRLTTLIVVGLLVAAHAWVVRAELSPPGPRELASIAVGQSHIHIAVEHGALEVSDADLIAWIRRSGVVVAGYFGRFPIPKLSLKVHTSSGKGTRTGNMKGWGEMPQINVWVGERSSREDLRRDWIMVHEMAHTAFPDVHDRHHWVEEGLAVYVESLARMQAGDLTEAHVWGEFASRMHHGLPKFGDQGLDRTSTWGRTYWGGALFLFLADMEIRRKTENRAGLGTVLRGILDAGYDARRRASLVEVFEAGDRATGTTVLMDLYVQNRHTAVDVDLDGIWRRLGVSVNAKLARFDDSAPEAWLRKAISAKP